MTESFKSQAENIVSAISRELSLKDEARKGESAIDKKANALFDRLMGTINDVDMHAAAARVDAIKAEYPDESPEQLVQRLIRSKTQKTASIGAATSGAGLLPGVGTLTAMVVGTAADIGATFKLQAELVLEIAAAHEYQLTEHEKKQLVLLITGLSAGARSLAQKAGQRAGIKFGEVFAEKAALKALPILGVVASAGTNALSTYIIGQRADAYFRLGEVGLQSWQDSLRAISGVDERKIGEWVGAQTQAAGKMAGNVGVAAGQHIQQAAQTVAQAGQNAVETQTQMTRHFWKSIAQSIKSLKARTKNLQLFHPKNRKES